MRRDSRRRRSDELMGHTATLRQRETLLTGALTAMGDTFSREVLQRTLSADASSDSEIEEEVCFQYDFSKLTTKGVLGAGGFGIVTLVKCNLTGQRLALKSLAKGNILQQDTKQCVMNEKWVMRLAHNPFVIRLAATFNRGDHLYFLMEPAMGGCLHRAYIQLKMVGHEGPARFYIACVVRAFEYLHTLNIIYRDLKPENVLLDANGYGKVADFGLSKIAIGHTYTTCGTPEYFAPELAKQMGHTRAVDWWTLGVVVFELMTGDTPFQGESIADIFNAILKGIELPLAKQPKESWASLVRELCKEKPSERLPMRPGGVEKIVEHPWYKDSGFEWSALDGRTMAAPFAPPPLRELPAFVRNAPKALPYTDPGDGWDSSLEDTVGPRDLAAFPGGPGASGGAVRPPLKRKPSKPQVSKAIPEERADVQPQEPQDAPCDLRRAFLALRSAADEGRGDSLDTASSCAEADCCLDLAACGGDSSPAFSDAPTAPTTASTSASPVASMKKNQSWPTKDLAASEGDISTAVSDAPRAPTTASTSASSVASMKKRSP